MMHLLLTVEETKINEETGKYPFKRYNMATNNFSEDVMVVVGLVVNMVASYSNNQCSNITEVNNLQRVKRTKISDKHVHRKIKQW